MKCNVQACLCETNVLGASAHVYRMLMVVSVQLKMQRSEICGMGDWTHNFKTTQFTTSISYKKRFSVLT